MNTKKITIIITNLGIGGAEKNILNLSDDWINKGFDVTLLLLKKQGELLSKINENVKIKELKTEKIRDALFGIFKYIKNEEEHIIWVNLWPLTSISIIAWIMAGKKGKIFVTDHNNLNKSYAGKSLIKKYVLRILVKATYKKATGITAVSVGLSNELVNLDKNIKGKLVVINNPIIKEKKIRYNTNELNQLRNELWGGIGYINILTVGELKLQKNHEMIIEAINNIKNKFEIKINVRIVGPGLLMNSLNKKISEYGLTDIIKLVGYQENTSKWYASSDIFILTSNWEGFGNVLVEAMEYGIPIISTDCPSGPREILKDGEYGILIECNDIEALEKSILKVINEEVNDKLKIIKRSKDFEISKISDQYLRLFSNNGNGYGKN